MLAPHEVQRSLEARAEAKHQPQRDLGRVSRCLTPCSF